jgi:quinol monooxygenase YgiN
MIIVSGTIRIDPADAEKAAEAATAVAKASRAEEGCSAYGFWQDLNDPGLYRVFEEWASQEAIDQHMATPHMAEFMGAMGQMTVTEMDLSRYEVSAKAPLFGG